MGDAIRYELRDGDVALIQMDDGKANALSLERIDELSEALERAAGEAKALVLTGREGKFCAGFDLTVMSKFDEASAELLDRGTGLALQIYTLGIPTVAACNGHALAMGALLLLSCDLRVGASGPYKLGLNEVAIGMTMPSLGIELGQARLSRRHITRAIALAEIYDPQGAVDAGFLDRLVDPSEVIAAALADAAGTSGLVSAAHAATKVLLRRDEVAAIGASRPKA